MENTMYSPEEIEKKRLLALQKKVKKTEEKENSSVKRKLMLNSQPHEAKQARIVSPTPPETFYGKSESIKIFCSMITESRFQVQAPYNQDLIKLFHKFSTKQYDPKTKLWNFHLDEYNTFLNEIGTVFGTRIIVSRIPSYVLQAFRTNLRKKSEEKPIQLEGKIDDKLLSQLMPFQREGIIYGIRKQGNCIIADDMGLGKTVQALAIANYFKDNWPLLIVAPSSVRYQWSESIYRFLPSIPAQHVRQFTNSKDYLGSELITIVSYDLFTRNVQIFEKRLFGFIILDESHSLKSAKTERTKSVKRIASQARHVLLLSGTPALSRPIELYTQLSLVCNNFMKIHEYGVRYCEGTQGAFGWDFKGSSNVNELQLLLKCTCLIRRLKSDVLKQLPDKIREVVILDPGLIKAATKEMEKMAAELKEKNLNGAERHGLLLKYYAESSKQKVLAVSNYIKDVIEKKMKFLVFAHHVYLLDSICQLLKKEKIGFIKIDGKTKVEDRKLYVDKFQQSDDCLVAVLSITAANAGITLTAASLVIFAELYWNPGTLSQAEDRVHRIGQKNGVVIQYLIAKGTADDYLWHLLQSKTRFLENAGLNQNFSFDQADLMYQVLSGDDLELSESMNQQSTLDDFVVTADLADEFSVEMVDSTSNNTESKPENQPSSSSAEATVASTSSENFGEFFNDDDDAFDDLDLDNMS